MASILVAGAGSVGTVLGASLALSDHHVILLRRQRNCRNCEITVEGAESFRVVADILTAEELGSKTFDIVFITCQSQDTANLANQIKSAVEAHTVLVSLQNGIANGETIRKYFPDNPLVVGTVWWSATQISDQLVYYHRKAPTRLGRWDDKTQHIHLLKVQDILQHKFETTIIDDIRLELYRKLVLNVVSPVLALVKQPYPQGLSDKAVAQLVYLMFNEAVEVLRAKNIYVLDDMLKGFQKQLETQNFPQEPVSSRYVHKVSTQISAEKHGGSGSNVTALLGPFIEFGKKMGVQTPAIERVFHEVLQLPEDYDAVSTEKIQRMVDEIIRHPSRATRLPKE